MSCEVSQTEVEFKFDEQRDFGDKSELEGYESDNTYMSEFEGYNSKFGFVHYHQKRFPPRRH